MTRSVRSACSAVRRVARRPLAVAVLALTLLVLGALAAPFGGVVQAASAPDRHAAGGYRVGFGPRDHGQRRDTLAACRRLGRADARLDRVLAGLVADGIVTQDQADIVANRLTPDAADSGGDRPLPAGCANGRSRGPAVGVVADLVGVTPRELRERLAAGRSLAEIAAAEGVAREALVADLRQVVVTGLDAAEASGRLDPATRADREARLIAAIDRLVDARRGDPAERAATPAP